MHRLLIISKLIGREITQKGKEQHSGNAELVNNVQVIDQVAKVHTCPVRTRHQAFKATQILRLLKGASRAAVPELTKYVYCPLGLEFAKFVHIISMFAIFPTLGTR